MLPSPRSRDAARNADVARARLSSIAPPPPEPAFDELPAAESLAAEWPTNESLAAAPPMAGPSAAGPMPDGLPDGGQRVGASGAARPWNPLPAGLRDARLVAPRQAATALIIVALLSAVGTAAALWWARPHASAVAAPPLVGPSADRPATVVPSPSPRSLVLSVVGRVRRPGLVTVPPGARLIDALRAAGGPLPGVDITPLNLARKVTDGEQIVVGGSGAGPGAAPSSPAGAPTGTPTSAVDLNSATLAELDRLPGIGPVIAQRILDWRSDHGGFTSVEQLRDVSGIGDRTFERIRGLVTV